MSGPWFQRTVGTWIAKEGLASVAIDRAQRGDKRPVACSSGRAGRYMYSRYAVRYFLAFQLLAISSLPAWCLPCVCGCGASSLGFVRPATILGWAFMHSFLVLWNRVPSPPRAIWQAKEGEWALLQGLARLPRPFSVWDFVRYRLDPSPNFRMEWTCVVFGSETLWDPNQTPLNLDPTRSNSPKPSIQTHRSNPFQPTKPSIQTHA
jgi:hypothetical protein